MKRITKDGAVAVSNITASPSVTEGKTHPGYGMVGSGSSHIEGVPMEYPHRLNTYVKPPNYEISIKQFEEFAIARLQVLRAVDNAMMRYQREDDIIRAVRAVEERFLPLHANESAAVYDLLAERRKDHASHFILRLACCVDADSVRWFINQEAQLFRLRWIQEMTRERMEFIKAHTNDLTIISAEEKQQNITELTLASPGKEHDDFFKVPFQMVPDLIGRRGVFLNYGFAYVPRSDAFSILATRFRENLEYWMERTTKIVPNIMDERLLPLLQLVKSAEANGLANLPTNGKGFIEGGKLTATELDSVIQHFPPCMLRLHQYGKRDHHLKYGGRQQLGLFLKGIGLPLDEAVQFWRRIFVPKCGEDGFAKSYLYNIRHNYGQEGKRANYGPTPCSKIINGAPPSMGDFHGCPFKHCSGDTLRDLIASNYDGANGGNKLDSVQIEDLVQTAKQGAGCQAACTRLFEYTRRPNQPVGQMEPFAYPTKFFEASVKFSQPKSTTK